MSHIPRMIGAFAIMIVLLLATAAAANAAPEIVSSNQSDVGALRLAKSVRAPSDVIRPGDVVEYKIELAYVGDGGIVETTLTDELPRGMRLVGRPQLTVDSDRVSPQQVALRDGQIVWKGSMTAGAKFTITYPMKAVRCFDGEVHRIKNVAVVLQPDGSELSAEAVVGVQCPLLNLDAIEVERTLLDDLLADNDPTNDDPTNDDPTDDAADGEVDALRESNKLRVMSTFTNNLEQEITLGLRSFEEVVPAATDEVDAAAITMRTQTRNLEKLTLAAGESKSVIQEIEIPERADDEELTEEDIISQLEYCIIGEDRVVCVTEDGIRQARPVRIRIRARDLGDAPDSSNHAGENMKAYVGINGHFPTVHNPATGRPPGPAHIFPGPFHLGQRVSREVEADRGRDADPLNNLLPRRDQANLDRHDDGLRAQAIDFVDCQTVTINVAVTISPRAVAFLRQQDGIGYLNMWLDSNRDGDWADAVACPTSTDGSTRALEHIVIDHAVDAGTLGAGNHVISVTTGVVSWPEKFDEKPAWLRATLSERKSNKTLPEGENRYGDGRGYVIPFALGETEDYKVRSKELVDGADVVVHKRGAARRDFESDNESVAGRTHWHIRYYNQGLETANDTVIRDLLPEELDLSSTSLKIRTSPEIPYAVDGHEIAFRVGDLESERGGHIVISANYAISTATAISVTNHVAISATNDVNLENNRDRAFAQLGLHAPVITWPGNGTTCNGELQVRGRARPGSEVDIYLNDALAATVTADRRGDWQHPMTLEDGTHDLHAVARLDDVASLASRTKTVIVDSSLAFDPLSIRFVDENGNHRRPLDEDGRTDESGWGLHLRPNMEYVVSVRLCCSDPDAKAAINIPNVGEVELAYNEEQDRFNGRFKTGDMADEPQREAMSLSVSCDGITSTFDGTVLIDPEGVITDARTGQLLSGATVSCLEAQPMSTLSDGNPVFTLWDAAEFGQVNPQSTLDDGYYSFWTPAGTYQITVERDGYQSYRSEDIQVVDELVRHDVALSPVVAGEADYVIEITEDGFSPSVLTVEPGAVVEWVNMDLADHTTVADGSTSAASAETGAMASAWNSGLLSAGEGFTVQLDAEGAYSYEDQANGLNFGTILVRANAEDSTPEPEDGGTTTLPTNDNQIQIFLPIVQE